MTASDDIFDGYWYCPTGTYPRIDGRPAPEDGCIETEPVFIADDGLTATGAATGVYRAVPTGDLPHTGFDPALLVAAVLLVVFGGGLRRIGRPVRAHPSPPAS